MTTAGLHCLLECHECPQDVLDDLAGLERRLRDAVAVAGAQVLQVASHRFQPAGVTVLALLSESHCSIHTWPLEGYAAVDFFTCGPHCRPREACEALAKALGASRHAIKVIARGDWKDSPCPGPALHLVTEA